MDGSVETGSLEKALGSERMLAPEAVTTMLRLRELGWGIKRIAREVGCAKATVRRWVNAGGFVAYRRAQRPGVLVPLESWMAERFRAHCGNADVVRQELASEHGIRVSLRTVERAVKPLRRALVAEARATVRFETPPGQQMRIDFGERRVWVADEPVRVHFFVATLGYSRRIFVQPFLYERQSDWLAGIEAAFVHFGGVAQELLVDNARTLVDRARCREPPGPLQRSIPRVRTALEHPGAGVRALPGSYEGQGRVGGRLRQEERDRRSQVRIDRAPGIAPGELDARDCRLPHPRQHRRSADRPLRCRGSGTSAGCRPFAVSAAARVQPPSAVRCLHRGRHQRLLGALAADRRHGPSDGRR
jgi:transposase